METILTHTGKIYVNREEKLEWLTVGDYGKEANIKANFLGLDKQIHGVPHTPVNLENKWVITVSTQKGCACRCKFCDVPKVGLHGNVSLQEFAYMIRHALTNEDCSHTKRLNIHYARMGEPTYNKKVLDFTKHHLDMTVNKAIQADTIHPVVSTMMPRFNEDLERFLQCWCQIKNIDRKGEAGLQLSIQSTDDKQRNEQFNYLSLPLEEIGAIAHRLPPPVGRKYTLNFAVTKDTILNTKRLTQLFNPKYWLVKITPIHQTTAAIKNGFDVSTSYDNYDVYEKFETPLLKAGWDVIVFVPSKEEDEDRITCGNALLGDKNENTLPTLRIYKYSTT